MENSIYKTCEVCSETKHISEFSKAYPRRCKACVAEQARLARSTDKENNKRMLIKQWNDPIDWEQRRYEIAKEMMATVERHNNTSMGFRNPTMQAQYAIECADALIAELKKGGQNV